MMFVALHCLELDSSWPKYQITNPLWEEAASFLHEKSSGDFNRTGNNDADVHEATAPHYEYGIKGKSQDKCKPDFCFTCSTCL